MIKWLLILLGGFVLILVALISVFAYKVWDLERGYPKSILSKNIKNTCVVSKRSFVLVKIGRDYMGAKLFDFLPKPNNRNYIYSDYISDTIKTEDGSEAYDVKDAISIPSGTRFTLKDGFQDRTMNGSDYFFWLEPEEIELDSHFYYSPFPIAHDPTVEGGVKFYSADDMSQFPDSLLFEKACTITDS